MPKSAVIWMIYNWFFRLLSPKKPICRHWWNIPLHIGCLETSIQYLNYGCNPLSCTHKNRWDHQDYCNLYSMKQTRIPIPYLSLSRKIGDLTQDLLCAQRAYFLRLIWRLFRAALFLFLRLFVRLRNARFQSGRFLFLCRSGSRNLFSNSDILNVSISGLFCGPRKLSGVIQCFYLTNLPIPDLTFLLCRNIKHKA